MRKRSISIKGHRTSISLEPQFWAALDVIAAESGLRLPQIVAEIDAGRLARTPAPGLASAIRVFVLERARRGPA